MKKQKYIILILIAGIFLACSDRKTTLSYEIYGETSKENPRYSTYMFFILLDSAYSETQLNDLEDSIYMENKKFRKPLEIQYRIPNPEKSFDDYAITTINRSGTFETIFEKDRKQEPTPTPVINPVSTDEIQLGTWVNEFGIYTIYKEKGVHYLENRFRDGSGNTETLRVKKRNGQTTYNVAGDNSEYMVIKNDGLYIYDSAGNLGLIYRNE